MKKIYFDVASREPTKFFDFLDFKFHNARDININFLKGSMNFARYILSVYSFTTNKMQEYELWQATKMHTFKDIIIN